MSQNSFPRNEHVVALRAAIKDHAGPIGDSFEVTEAGLDRYRCQYRLLLSCRDAGWSEEIQVHFQVAEKLLERKRVEAFVRQIDAAILRCRAALTSQKD